MTSKIEPGVYRIDNMWFYIATEAGGHWCHPDSLDSGPWVDWSGHLRERESYRFKPDKSGITYDEAWAKYCAWRLTR